MSDSLRAGLVFVAFGKSIDAFEAPLKSMVDVEDGTVDALFNAPGDRRLFLVPAREEGEARFAGNWGVV